MRLKLRLGDTAQFSKTEIGLLVKEVRLRQNLINKSDTVIELCFKDGSASGILELTAAEYQQLSKRIKNALSGTPADTFLNEES